MKNVIEKTITPADTVNGPKTTILFAKIFAITISAATRAIGNSTPYFFPKTPAKEPIAKVAIIHNMTNKTSILFNKQIYILKTYRKFMKNGIILCSGSFSYKENFGKELTFKIKVKSKSIT